MTTRINYNILFAVAVLLFAALSGCDKSEPLTIPASRASFLGTNAATYYVLDDPNSTFAVQVGFTTVSDKDRTITFSVTPSANAKEGTDYTISSKSVTVPAGKLTDSILVKGVFSAFADQHVDTLTFAIDSTSGSEGLSGDSTLTLVIQKLCPYDVSNISGNMQVIKDDWADYQPGDVIPVSVIDDTHVSFEYGAANAKPIVIAINPSTNTTSVAKQVYGDYPGSGYGDFSAQSVAGSPDNYIDPCNNIISVRLVHSVSAGTFPDDYQIILKKTQ